ncbi:PAS domain-containing protein [bacterium]|nr:MAG: PAS domain-containing protein [bacterium]
MAAPLPINEEQRLNALRSYQILDTPPEAAFERLTRLSARLFQTPISLVSLVDGNRQWFKSCFGIDTCESNREHSFCAYTILLDHVMVVPDATQDPRFSNNIFVTGEPHIRFYAGAPLVTPDGLNIGTLCVIDTKSRQFDEQQQRILSDLAATVMDELELLRTARELSERELALRDILRSNSQLAVAVSTLSSGVIITDATIPDDPIIYANDGFCSLTGYAPAEILGRNCRFLQGPDTDPVAVQEMREAIAQRRSHECILLNYRRDGSPFLNEIIINPVFDGEGKLTSFVGVEHDVTEREQSRQSLEEKVQERTADLASSQMEILQRLARAAEFRDDDTGRHTQRVAHNSALIARALGLPETQVELIREAAPLHDVGKIAISDLILLKPGKLTKEEFDAMKTHAAIGAALLSEGKSEVVQIAERIAGGHHECWDGGGYPKGISGEEIPIEARILAVADVFDALTHERTYKKAWSVEAAVAEITQQSGYQFDPKIVEAFLTLPHREMI